MTLCTACYVMSGSPGHGDSTCPSATTAIRVRMPAPEMAGVRAEERLLLCARAAGQCRAG